ncbi:MAG: hypothetical protein MJ105_06725 [Lachnospiraceae bacterium]|nr:hypothetical protein [Lachnospiraceae bacterium]
MKRMFCCVVTGILSFSVLVGCGSKNAGAKEEAKIEDPGTVVIEQPVSEKDTVVEEETAVLDTTTEDQELAVLETTEDQDLAVSETITDEQALAAIQNYCYISNPSLVDIVNEGQYAVSWEVSSSDENEIVVLYISYTGAQVRYYIDRNTGDTYVTEFVPGILDEEEQTDERFNVKDYFDQ